MKVLLISEGLLDTTSNVLEKGVLILINRYQLIISGSKTIESVVERRWFNAYRMQI